MCAVVERILLFAGFWQRTQSKGAAFRPRLMRYKRELSENINSSYDSLYGTVGCFP